MKDFIKGMGSSIDLFPNNKETSFKPLQSNEDAIKKAWEDVGNAMRSAMGNVDKSL